MYVEFHFSNSILHLYQAAREGQAFKKKRLVMMWHKPESVSSEASSSQESQDNPQTGKVVEEVTAIEEEVDTLVVEAADDAEVCYFK